MDVHEWGKLKQRMLEGLADYGLSLAGMCVVVSGAVPAPAAKGRAVYAPDAGAVLPEQKEPGYRLPLRHW